jgi:hypothetical protein
MSKSSRYSGRSLSSEQADSVVRLHSFIMGFVAHQIDTSVYIWQLYVRYGAHSTDLLH